MNTLKSLLLFIDLVGINFSGFIISSSDTYQVLFGLSIVSSDDEPSLRQFFSCQD